MKQVNLTNEQLLGAVRLGDCAAFNEVYHRFSKKVYGYAYRFTRSDEEAEELTHDTFVRVWENRSKIDCSKNFEGFLFTIIRNSFLKALRNNAKENLFYNENIRAEPSYDAVNEYLNFKDCKQIAGSAIEAMSPQVKIAFLLSRDQGCSHEEISRQMGISKNTVSNHLKSSLKMIRNYIKVYSPETIISLMFVIFC